MAKSPKQAVQGSVRINAYIVLCRAIEEGVAVGWRQAHKHTADPTGEALRDAMENEVLNALCEVFEFDEKHD
jgi:hypothetical protein